MHGKDSLMTMRLWQYQKEKLNQPDQAKVKDVFFNIEMPLEPILVDMFEYGVNINMDMLNQLYKKYNTRLQEAQKVVYDEISKYNDEIERYKLTHYNHKLDNPINIGSPVQLSTLFYNILKYKTKNGKGTGVAELEEINTPLTRALLDYRKMSKLIDAFLVSLPKQIEPTTGKIHTSLNQYGAATGRFSSSSPNLQQIPSRGEAKEIRRIFGATKGYILMSSDFSQQEPRSLASLCKDPNMLNAYVTGKDLYATMASQIYKLPYEDCMEFYLDENGNKTDKTNPEGKKRRSNTKGILLGIMYGRGVASVAEVIHETKEDAQKIIDSFYESYPKIREYTEYVQKQAIKNGYTETAWGRRRYLPHIQDEKYEYHYNDRRPIDFNPLFTADTHIKEKVPQNVKDEYNKLLDRSNITRKRQIIEQAKQRGIDIIDNEGFLADAMRQCLNSTIQGTAADITKRAMISIGNNKELKDLGFKMLFPVHDEILAECPFENRKRCGELLRQLMIDAAKPNITCPMKTDVEYFFYWYGPDVNPDDTDITQKQYEDYLTTGVYKDEEYYQ